MFEIDQGGWPCMVCRASEQWTLRKQRSSDCRNLRKLLTYSLLEHLSARIQRGTLGKIKSFFLKRRKSVGGMLLSSEKCSNCTRRDGFDFELFIPFEYSNPVKIPQPLQSRTRKTLATSFQNRRCCRHCSIGVSIIPSYTQGFSNSNLRSVMIKKRDDTSQKGATENSSRSLKSSRSLLSTSSKCTFATFRIVAIKTIKLAQKSVLPVTVVAMTLLGCRSSTA
jgi:hypothetical protein